MSAGSPSRPAKPWRRSAAFALNSHLRARPLFNASCSRLLLQWWVKMVFDPELLCPTAQAAARSRGGELAA